MEASQNQKDHRGGTPTKVGMHGVAAHPPIVGRKTWRHTHQSPWRHTHHSASSGRGGTPTGGQSRKNVWYISIEV